MELEKIRQQSMPLKGKLRTGSQKTIHVGYAYKWGVLLTHVEPIYPFLTIENIRKPCAFLMMYSKFQKGNTD